MNFSAGVCEKQWQQGASKMREMREESETNYGLRSEKKVISGLFPVSRRLKFKIFNFKNFLKYFRKFKIF
jgi:hypothetical protein